MKRLFSLLFSVLFIFTLCACSSENEMSELEKQYYDYAQECIEKGDTQTAIDSLEEGITNTGSEELQKLLEEIKGDEKASSSIDSDSETKTSDDNTPKVTKYNVKNATASSFLNDPNATILHKPQRVIDGDNDTAWVEGAKGNGLGEYIKLSLDRECYVSGFEIWAGYHKTKKLYNNNARPKEIIVTFTDGSSCTYTLRDIMQKQTIAFDEAVKTDSIIIEISSVYPGAVFQDTVITEISLF